MSESGKCILRTYFRHYQGNEKGEIRKGEEKAASSSFSSCQEAAGWKKEVSAGVIKKGGEREKRGKARGRLNSL